MNEWISIGRIGRPKGLKGEVRVEVYNRDSRLLEEIPSICAGSNSEDLQPLSIRGCSKEVKGCVVSFEKILTREDAARLTGKEIFVQRSALPKLGKGEYYCCDLIGCSVVSESGETLGRLKEVMTTPSNDIYVVEGPSGEILIPVIEGVVVSVDLSKETIVVRPPEVMDAS